MAMLFLRRRLQDSGLKNILLAMTALAIISIFILSITESGSQNHINSEQRFLHRLRVSGTADYIKQLLKDVISTKSDLINNSTKKLVTEISAKQYSESDKLISDSSMKINHSAKIKINSETRTSNKFNGKANKKLKRGSRKKTPRKTSMRLGSNRFSNINTNIPTSNLTSDPTIIFSTKSSPWRGPSMTAKHNLTPQERRERKARKQKEQLEEMQYLDSQTGTNDTAGLPVRINPKHKKNYGRDVVVTLENEWTPKMALAREKVFQNRSAHIRQVCQTFDWKKYAEPSKEFLKKNIRWATKYNLLWCPIFKAASTTWVKNFLSLAGEKKIMGSLHGRVRALYPPPEDEATRDTLLSTCTKMIIVRHPLDRLLSAYRDKMLRVLRENDPYHKLQREIAKQYKDPYVSSSNDITVSNKPEQPSFNQFLMRVRDDMATHTKKPRRFAPINLHWRPYWTTCSPCHINYDVIAKVETLDEDQEYIIHEAKLEGLAFNARTHASNFDKYKGTSEATRAYFSHVPRSLLEDVVRLYQPDFSIFNYSAEEYLNLTVQNL